MAGEYGIGLGISQGLEKVNQAFDRRSELQMLAQQQEQQRQIGSVNLSNAEQQNKILMEKVAQMERDKTKTAAFQAFDSFEATSDPKYLNLAIRDNSLLKDAMASTGITGIGKISDLSPEKLQQLGYKEEEFVRPVVYYKNDGTQQLGDLFTEYGKFGYLERAQENVLNDYKTKVEALKYSQEFNKTAVGGVEAENYLTYVDSMIAKGEVPLPMKEFGKPAKDSTGSDIKTHTQAVVKLAELETKPESELTPLELSQKKHFKALATTDSDEKRQIISESLKVSDKFLDGVSDKEVTLDDVKTITTAGALVGDHGDKATSKSLTDNYVTLKQGYKLADNINKLSTEEIERGIVDKGFLETKKLLSDKDFAKLPADEKAKALQTVKFDTRMGSYLADYIRSISGTAASEAEFERLKNVLTGGSFNNTQSLKSAITEFVTVEDEKFKGNLDAKYMLAKGDVLKLKYNYDKELKGKLVTTSQQTTKPQITQEEALAEARRRGLIK